MTDKEVASRAVYTGTHDNQTLMGWCTANGMTISDALEVVKEVYATDAPWVMLQFQDMFMLGDETRMNVPGVPEGNWTWKIPGESVEKGLPNASRVAFAFKQMALANGRLQ